MADSRYQDLGKGRRKTPRRSFSYPIKAVGLDAVQWDGFIVDISDSGAQIEFFEAPDLPAEFSLLIGGNKMVKRHCHVVWRSGERLGVRFVRPPR